MRPDGDATCEKALERCSARHTVLNIRRQQSERVEIPAVQRQFHNALIIDNIAEDRVLRVDDGNFRGHIDRFGHAAGLERCIQSRALRHLQNQSLVHFRSETIGGNSDFVLADRKVRQNIVAIRICRRFAYLIGSYGLGSNQSAGDVPLDESVIVPTRLAVVDLSRKRKSSPDKQGRKGRCESGHISISLNWYAVVVCY